jgi:hypothetical protein
MSTPAMTPLTMQEQDERRALVESAVKEANLRPPPPATSSSSTPPFIFFMAVLGFIFGINAISKVNKLTTEVDNLKSELEVLRGIVDGLRGDGTGV